MKAIADALRRLEPLRIPPSESNMYTDPETDVIAGVRAALVQRLAQAPAGSVIPIEFGPVDLSASCHSSILGPVLEQRVLRGFHGRFLMGVDTTGRNEWDADAGLKKESERLGRKLVCVWETTAGGLS